MQQIKRNSPGKQPKDSRPRNSSKKSTNADMSARLDKVEEDLDQMRNQFDKMMSDSIHLVMAARPGNFEPPMGELSDRANRKRQSNTPYPMATSGRRDRQAGNPMLAQIDSSRFSTPLTHL